MVAPRKNTRKGTSSAKESAKAKRTSKSRPMKDTLSDLIAVKSKELKDLKSMHQAEVIREWRNQYHQGKSIVSDLHGMGCGFCWFISPFVEFFSPCRDKGHFEVMGGTKGTGSGSIRLCMGDSVDLTEGHIFLIPFQHIGQFVPRVSYTKVLV